MIASLTGPAFATAHEQARWEAAVAFWHDDLHPGTDWAELTPEQQDEIWQVASECLALE